MRPALLGTTALMAASLLGAKAQGAEGIRLGLGGHYEGAAGAALGEPDAVPRSGNRRPDLDQDIEIRFHGETTLDNGLTLGARIVLLGLSARGPVADSETSDFLDSVGAGNQIDEAYAYAEGGFGEIRFGDTEEILQLGCYQVPSASGIFGADSPEFNFSHVEDIGGYSATNGTCYGIAADGAATQILYLTPVIAGFWFGVSYAPDDTKDSRNTVAGGAGGRLSNDVGQNSRLWSFATQYQQEFGDLDLILGAAYSTSDREAAAGGAKDRQEINAYAQVELAGFTIGGAYSRRLNISSAVENVNAQVYGAGITYEIEAWTAGLGWTRGEYDVSSEDDTDTYDIYSLTGSYALGPGIEVGAVAEYYDYEDDTEGTGDATDADYSAWGVGIGIEIEF